MLSVSTSRAFWSLGLAQRITLFIVVFGAEWVPILNKYPPGIGGRSVFRLGVICGSFFLALGSARLRSSFQSISTELENQPLAWGFFAGHICTLLTFLQLSSILPGSTPTAANVVAPLRYLTGTLAVGFAGFAAVPPKSVWRFVREAGSAWAFALPAGLVAWGLVSTQFGDLIWNGAPWRPAAVLTFGLVKALLDLFIPRVVANPATMTLGSPEFAVTIGAPCAGWEGTALMFVFSVSWLCVRWREFRYPHALLLIPTAMLAMWVSNAIRIAVLILIGVAGAPEVAINGFHSEAGWIAFNCVALSFAVFTRKLSWIAVQSPEAPAQRRLVDSLTAACLLPFLAIEAAAMISHGFEWLYPLRPVAALAMLWFFRAKYRELDWRFGWSCLGLGGIVFAIWLAPSLFSSTHAEKGIALGMASWAASPGMAWLACRIAAAVIIVPVAEELAFRGFLIRHLISGGCELLSRRKSICVAIVISSTAFGLLQGSHRLAGTAAGLFYGAAFCRKGRIGDAVAAHVTTNVLLLAWVLWSGDWSLW